jgi:toxin CptA
MRTQPLTLSIRPSRRLRFAHGFLHGLAALAILVSGISDGLRIGLIAALGVSYYLGRPEMAPLGMRLERNGQLAVKRGEGWQSVELLPSTMVTPWLSVLHWREGGRFRAFAILGDSLPAGDFRRLRIWLKWKAKLGAVSVPGFDDRGGADA